MARQRRWHGTQNMQGRGGRAGGATGRAQPPVTNLHEQLRAPTGDLVLQAPNLPDQARVSPATGAQRVRRKEEARDVEQGRRLGQKGSENREKREKMKRKIC